MAKDKKGFILYADQKELFDQLPNDKAGELIKHIFKYVNDDNPITKDVLINMAFTPIKQQFKRDLKKWETTREGRSKAGKASAEARANKKEQELTNSTNVKSVEQTITNPTVNVNDTVTVNVNEKVIKNKEINFDKFLDWFNERRTKYIEKPSNIKRLTHQEKTTLALLKTSYSSEDFEFAMYNFCNDQWANENKQVLCSYFLQIKTFNKFLSTEKTTMLTKDQRRRQGWKV